MKRITLMILLFCIQLISGCRTTKSVEALNTSTDYRSASIEEMASISFHDSLARTLHLVADSMIIYDAQPVFKTSAYQLSPRAKAWGVIVNGTQSVVSHVVADSIVKNKELNITEKQKQRTKVKSSTNNYVYWVAIALGLLVGLTIFIRCNKCNR